LEKDFYLGTFGSFECFYPLSINYFEAMEGNKIFNDNNQNMEKKMVP
jgi:hypothetical protein